MLAHSVTLIIVLSVFSGGLSFVMNSKHLLSSLLSLEFLAVSVFWLMGSGFLSFIGEVFFNLYYLVVVVCEGALGLSLLVVLSYSFGSDEMKSIAVSMC